MSLKNENRAVKISDKQRKINPKSLANLKPFKAGKSGNPSGRPIKNNQLIEALIEYGRTEYIEKKRLTNDMLSFSFEDEWEEIATGRTNSQELIKMIWKRAQNGEWNYLSLLIHFDVVQPK
jgi:hypothetical protein